MIIVAERAGVGMIGSIKNPSCHIWIYRMTTTRRGGGDGEEDNKEERDRGEGGVGRERMMR